MKQQRQSISYKEPNKSALFCRCLQEVYDGIYEMLADK